MKNRLPIAVLLLGSLATAGTGASAQQKPPGPAPDAGDSRPSQPPEIRPFGTVDYAATAGTLALYYALELGLDEPTRPHWTRPVPLMDRPARALFRFRTRAGRERADELSDRLWIASTTYPVAMAIAAPLASGRGFATTWQMTMMNLQAYVVASVLVRIPHKLIGRTRPLSRGCERNPEYSNQCGTDRVYLSFYGGHTAISMTGAGLACAHHLNGELFGVAWADALGCGAALAAATGVFVTRLQADKHWLSDQLLAAAVGLGVGYGLPTLLYYHPFFHAGAGSNDEGNPSIVLPSLGPGQIGATWVGQF